MLKLALRSGSEAQIQTWAKIQDDDNGTRVRALIEGCVITEADHAYRNTVVDSEYVGNKVV
jgi:hypothetical protein